MKKHLIIFLVATSLLLISGFVLYSYSDKKPETFIESQCETKELTFYYLDQCTWCQKVKNEGTLSKLEEMGVKITKINAKTGSVSHQFSWVPTFVINGKVYSGYRNIEDLKELLNCN